MQICLTWRYSHKEQTKKIDFWKKRSKNDLDMDRTCPGEVIGTWYQPSWVPSLSWRLAAPAAGSAGDAPGFQIFDDKLHFICSFAVINYLCDLSVVSKFGHEALFAAETVVYVVDVDNKKNGSQHRPLDDRADHVPPFGVFPIHQYPLFSLTQPFFNPQNDFIGEVESFELL